MNRSIEGGPSPRCFAPQCNTKDDAGIVSLLPEEMAVMNLIDLQGLEQEEAATMLGVSRKTVWRDIHDARRKVADALINGKTLEISGCQQLLKGNCPRRERGICPKEEGGTCPRLVLPTRPDNDNTRQFQE